MSATQAREHARLSPRSEWFEDLDLLDADAASRRPGTDAEARSGRVGKHRTSGTSEYRFVKPGTDDGRLGVDDRASCTIVDEQGRRSFWQGVAASTSPRAKRRRRRCASPRPSTARSSRTSRPSSTRSRPTKTRRTLYVNPQVEKLLGYTREEWLDQPDIWMEILHPDDREPTLAAHDQHNETGEPWSREYRLIASDGQVVWFRDEATLVRDAQGGPPLVAGRSCSTSPRRRTLEDGAPAQRTTTSSAASRSAPPSSRRRTSMMPRGRRAAPDRGRAPRRHENATACWSSTSQRSRTSGRSTRRARRDPRTTRARSSSRCSAIAVDEWNVTTTSGSRACIRTIATGSWLRRCGARRPASRYGQEYRFLAKDGHIVWVHDEADAARTGRRTARRSCCTASWSTSPSTRRLRGPRGGRGASGDDHRHLAGSRLLWLAYVTSSSRASWHPAAYIEPRSSRRSSATGRRTGFDRPTCLARWHCTPTTASDVASCLDVTSDGSARSGHVRVPAHRGGRRIVWVRDVGQVTRPRRPGPTRSSNGHPDRRDERAASRSSGSRRRRALYRTLVEQIPGTVHREVVG